MIDRTMPSSVLSDCVPMPPPITFTQARSYYQHITTSTTTYHTRVRALHHTGNAMCVQFSKAIMTAAMAVQSTIETPPSHGSELPDHETEHFTTHEFCKRVRDLEDTVEQLRRQVRCRSSE